MNRKKTKSVWTNHVLIIFVLVIVGVVIFFADYRIQSSERVLRTNTVINNQKEENSIPSIATDSNPSTPSNKPTISTETSPFAYVTLISGIADDFKYHGFLYNALIMRKALTDMGSTADFVVLLGFNQRENASFFEKDKQLLASLGIKLFYLPRFVDESHRLSFAEMALLKITPWSFTQYKRVQFLDGDVMPTKNLDCFFGLQQNTFTVGAASPLNSGWYLAIPKIDDFVYMRNKAVWRLGRDWDKQTGWAEPLPATDPLHYRGQRKPCLLWDFNGADMDQGLFTHYFILNEGRGLLVDTEHRSARRFQRGLLYESSESLKASEAFSVCGGADPTSYFLHFTGQSKPWIASSSPKNAKDAIMWKRKLEDLKLNITLEARDLKSPLGYWNHNFPKGGFKVDASKLNGS